MESKEQKQYYVRIKGQKVYVTEEVYRAYVRPARARQRAELREQKCYVKGKKWERVRCTRDCSTCPYAQEKNKVTGTPLSLEQMYEQGIEICSDMDMEAIFIEKETQKEHSFMVHEAISKLKDRYQYILTEVYLKGRTQEAVRKELGVNKSTMSKQCKYSVKALKKILDKN